MKKYRMERAVLKNIRDISLLFGKIRPYHFMELEKILHQNAELQYKITNLEGKIRYFKRRLKK